MSWRVRLPLLALFGAAAVFAHRMADGYIDRLADHSGYFLVGVDDAVGAPYARPRHTVVILVDGLTKSAAEGFAAKQRLAAAGQCRTMEVGPMTVSRPIYAVYSTGLEEDRTGCRNNFEESRPLAARSIWQQARRAGLQVTAVSAVPWWRDLFPDGFDKYRLLGSEDDDPFAPAELGDLTLLHPLYVDHMGHRHGAASPQYEEAARRADAGILGLLGRLDLAQDLVVFTSDHGHTARGGHGGPGAEVAEVTTCFAGRGVARGGGPGRLDPRALGPTVALLLGVPFPSHMRAGEDDLEAMFEIADGATLGPAYVADRRAALARFRDGNRAALERWLGPGVTPTWSTLYARELGAQRRRLGAGGALLLGLLAGAAWLRRLRGRWLVGFLVWNATTIAVILASYAALRGSLDFSSINTRDEFLRAALGVGAAGLALSLLAHRLALRDGGRMVGDLATFVVLLAAAVAIHPFAYGWPLACPLPNTYALFFPFLAPIVLLVAALLGLLTTGASWALATVRRRG